MGGVRNGVAEEDLCQDLNPGAAAMGVPAMWFWEFEPCGLVSRKTRCNRHGELSVVQKNAGETMQQGKG